MQKESTISETGRFSIIGPNTKKFLGLFLVLTLAACAPWNAAIQRAIAQTQTAAANAEQVETPLPIELTPTESGEANSPPVDETASPIPVQGEATNPAVAETASPIPGQTETPPPDMTAEPAVPGETATPLPFASEMIPPKTAAPASKDTGSGLLIVAILFLVGVFVQLESKEGKKHP
ncbi:MAG: hypothetical protein ABSF99_11505 [Anaerolineales bacterium]|jgi:hypothetical protein